MRNLGVNFFAESDCLAIARYHLIYFCIKTQCCGLFAVVSMHHTLYAVVILEEKRNTEVGEERKPEGSSYQEILVICEIQPS